jgi:hypothetical protein
MNERIDRLIDQCTVQGFSDCVGGYETFDKEKFAESLIKECIKLVEGVEPSYKDYRSQIEESMQSEIVFVLKENFGIEE